MSALAAALDAVHNGTGCPRCLVGRRDLMADPQFRCDVCRGTGVPHFVLLATAEELLAALKSARATIQKYYGYYEAEFRVSTDPPDAELARELAVIDAAIAKAEGR